MNAISNIDKLKSNYITRRDFCATTSLGIVSTILFPLISAGCTSTTIKMAKYKEEHEDLISQEWDCNQILPIPPKGCFTGTNKGLTTENLIDFFSKNYGLRPTFHAFGTSYFSASNYYFPKYHCEKAINNGVIPVVRYVIDPFNGYKEIINGKYDKWISEFAIQTAKFSKPIVFIPFQQPNQPRRSYSWGSYRPDEYIKSWIRIHNIFEENGANSNTIWSTKICLGRWKYFQYKDPFSYIPPSEYIDIIGWLTNNVNKPNIHLNYQSFKSLFNSAYVKARVLYPNKPQMFWELSSAHGPSQAEWMDDALTRIKSNYPAVKGVSFDQLTYRNDGDYATFGFYHPDHTKETIEVVRKHFADSYFIGSAI